MIAAALLLAEAASANLPRAQYRTAEMGMSLAQWRAQPFPGPVRPDEVAVNAICTDLRDAGKLPDPLFLSSAERDMGVVKCAYYADSKMRLGFPLGSVVSTYRKRLPIGRDLTMKSVEYSFYQGRLFRISAIAEMAAADDIVEGLAARFGPSTSQDDGVVQNKAGATFPKQSRRWVVGPDAIQFEAPGGGRVDTASVLYLEIETARRIDDEREKRDPAAGKM